MGRFAPRANPEYKFTAGETELSTVVATDALSEGLNQPDCNRIINYVLRSALEAAFAIGRIESNYEYRTDLGDDVKHTRRAKWWSASFPRSAIDQDLGALRGVKIVVVCVHKVDAGAHELIMCERRYLQRHW